MKKIVVIPNETKDKELKVTKTLIEILKNRAVVVMEKEFSGISDGIEFKNNAGLYDGADFAIVLGGYGNESVNI